MKDVFFNQILPPILAAIGVALSGIFVAVIKSVGSVANQYISKKKEVVEQRLKLDKHEEVIIAAKEIWNVVEENFRITDNIENLAQSKANDFNKLLLQKCPWLTQSEINDVRQAIAGEYNKGKETLLNEDNLKKQAKEIIDKNGELQTKNKELKAENETLKAKLASISNVATVPENKEVEQPNQ